LHLRQRDSPGPCSRHARVLRSPSSVALSSLARGHVSIARGLVSREVKPSRRFFGVWRGWGGVNLEQQGTCGRRVRRWGCRISGGAVGGDGVLGVIGSDRGEDVASGASPGPRSVGRPDVGQPGGTRRVGGSKYRSVVRHRTRAEGGPAGAGLGKRPRRLRRCSRGRRPEGGDGRAGVRPPRQHAGPLEPRRTVCFAAGFSVGRAGVPGG
jgi:hypothetical protein